MSDVREVRHSDGHACPIALSPRQSQVIGLIAWGCTDAEIAQELGITLRTVRAHGDALKLKLGVRRRKGLVAAYRHLTGTDPATLEFPAAVAPDTAASPFGTARQA